MLYDGALRFARQAREALVQGDLEASCEAILRTQKIVLEMNSSLRFDIDRDLCTRLASIYNYIYRRLVEANTRHDLEALDEAIELTEYQRQTWLMLMDELKGQRGEAAPAEPAGVNIAG